MNKILNIRLLDTQIKSIFPEGEIKLFEYLLGIVNTTQENEIVDCAKFNLAILGLLYDFKLSDLINQIKPSFYSYVWDDLLLKYSNQPEIWFWAAKSSSVHLDIEEPDHFDDYIQKARGCNPYLSYLFPNLDLIKQDKFNYNKFYELNSSFYDTQLMFLQNNSFANIKLKIKQNFLETAKIQFENRFNHLGNMYINIHTHFSYSEFLDLIYEL